MRIAIVNDLRLAVESLKRNQPVPIEYWQPA